MNLSAIYFAFWMVFCWNRKLFVVLSTIPPSPASPILSTAKPSPVATYLTTSRTTSSSSATTASLSKIAPSPTITMTTSVTTSLNSPTMITSMTTPSPMTVSPLMKTLLRTSTSPSTSLISSTIAESPTVETTESTTAITLITASLSTSSKKIRSLIMLEAKSRIRKSVIDSKLSTTTVVPTTTPLSDYGQYCTEDSNCKPNIGLVCDMLLKYCVCDRDHFEEHHKCKSKIPYGEDCTKKGSCRDENVICNHTCICKGRYFYSKVCQSLNSVDVSHFEMKHRGNTSMGLKWKPKNTFQSIEVKYIMHWNGSVFPRRVSTEKNNIDIKRLIPGRKYKFQLFIHVYDLYNLYLFSHWKSLYLRTSPPWPIYTVHVLNPITAPKFVITLSRKNGFANFYVIKFGTNSQKAIIRKIYNYEKRVIFENLDGDANYGIQMFSHAGSLQVHSTKRWIKTNITIPRVPTNFTVLVVGASAVNLNWVPAKHHSGPTTYIVLTCGESDRDSKKYTRCQRNVVTHDQTYYIKKKLRRGWNYMFRLIIRTIAGEVKSGVQMIKTHDWKSGPIARLAVKNATTSKFTVVWVAPHRPNGKILGYKLIIENSEKQVATLDLSCILQSMSEHRLVDKIPELHVVIVCETEKESYMNQIISDLLPYTEYNVTMYAYNEAGNGMSTTIPARTSGLGHSAPYQVAGITIGSLAGVLALGLVVFAAFHFQRRSKQRHDDPDEHKKKHVRDTISAKPKRIYSKWKKNRQTKKDTTINHQELIPTGYLENQKLEDNSYCYSDESISEENPDLVRPIKMVDFSKRLKELHRNFNYLFNQEYMILHENSPRRENIMANLPGNRGKNRYINILAYDHSLVKLIKIQNDESTCYINANFIPGYNSTTEYIATQGPQDGTVKDFWRMIWEYNVPIIIMLTGITEGNTKKCAMYWCDDMKVTKQYGFIGVTLVERKKLRLYVLKTFVLTVKNIKRTVKHFFMPQWKDFEANLKPADIIEFIADVRQIRPAGVCGPVVVHCSAGVGRSGTFIALDYLIQYIASHTSQDTVDIFKLVIMMRRFRPHMVQSQAQYVFIYDVTDMLIMKKLAEEGVQCTNNADDGNHQNDAYVGDDGKVLFGETAGTQPGETGATQVEIYTFEPGEENDQNLIKNADD